MRKAIVGNGRIATLTKANKEHMCRKCLGLIARGDLYYSVVVGGSGLAGLKFPERFHTTCLPKGVDELRNATEEG